MAIDTEFTLNCTAKTINHVSGTTRYTVQALYSHIMDLMDNAENIDDTVPIKANTPTEFELINGWTFGADTDLGYLKGGSIIDNANSDIWANFYTLGSIATGSVVYWMQDGALVASEPTYTTGHIDQLIKVTDGGTDIDGKNVTAFIRNLGDKYDHFQVTATATGGRNPVPLATEADLNDNELGGSVTGVTIAFGTAAKDIGDGSGAVNYDVVIDGGGNAIVDVYRYLKYITRRENSTAIDSPENTTAGRFYQAANAAYAQTKAAPFGTFAGGKFFGARGVWVENVSDPNNRELIDAAGVTHTPPVAITVSVTGVVSGDRVLVAESSSGTINKSKYTISSTTGSTVVATAGIASYTPASGTIRVGDTQFAYTGWSGSTFTGVTPDPSGQSGAFYTPLIDAAASSTSISSASMIYSSDFEVVGRVRKKGILPFENTGTVTSAGLTISAIRTTDTIAV